MVGGGGGGVQRGDRGRAGSVVGSAREGGGGVGGMGVFSMSVSE